MPDSLHRLSFFLQFPELCLPLLAGIIGGILIFVLMLRSPENRGRLLPFGILLPSHALLFPLAFLPDSAVLFVTYVVSAPVLLLGLISYLWVLSRRKQLGRPIRTAAALWIVYFGSIVVMLAVIIMLAHDMSR